VPNAKCGIASHEPRVEGSHKRHKTHNTIGETREERRLQYLEENDVPVVGLRVPSMLRVEGGDVTLLGTAPARIFRRGMAPFEVPPGARLDAHLG
jgi:hypothetical protein